MKDTLEVKVCEHCHKKSAEEVINYEEGKAIRKGWYCVKCYHFDQAIGREKRVSEG